MCNGCYPPSTSITVKKREGEKEIKREKEERKVKQDRVKL